MSVRSSCFLKAMKITVVTPSSVLTRLRRRREGRGRDTGPRRGGDITAWSRHGGAWGGRGRGPARGPREDTPGRGPGVRREREGRVPAPRPCRRRREGKKEGAATGATRDPEQQVPRTPGRAWRRLQPARSQPPPQRTHSATRRSSAPVPSPAAPSSERGCCCGGAAAAPRLATYLSAQGSSVAPPTRRPRPPLTSRASAGDSRPPLGGGCAVRVEARRDVTPAVAGGGVLGGPTSGDVRSNARGGRAGGRPTGSPRFKFAGSVHGDGPDSSSLQKDSFTLRSGS